MREVLHTHLYAIAALYNKLFQLLLNIYYLPNQKKLSKKSNQRYHYVRILTISSFANRDDGDHNLHF